MSTKTRIGAIFNSDIRTAFRDLEQLLLMILIPVLFLIFFSQVDVIEFNEKPINFLTPGILTLGLISISFVRLAISIGFDRSFSAISRYALTPLRSSEFFLGKFLVTTALIVIQFSILIGIAFYLQWQPEFKPEIIGAAILGLIIFTALGYAIGGTFEGLRAVAISNAIFILLLLFSGLIFEIDKLPDSLAQMVKYLPSTALAENFRQSLSGQHPENWTWITLGIWTLATPLVAIRTFRWR